MQLFEAASFKNALRKLFGQATTQAGPREMARDEVRYPETPSATLSTLLSRGPDNVELDSDSVNTVLKNVRTAERKVISLWGPDCPNGLVSEQELEGGVQLRFKIVRNALILSDPDVIAFIEGERCYEIMENTPYHDRTSLVRMAARQFSLDDGNANQFNQMVSFCSEWAHNFWHWLTECLPYALVMENQSYSGYYRVRSDVVFQKESLSFIGVCSERIVYSDQKPVLCNEIIIPKIVQGQLLNERKDLIEFCNQSIRRQVCPTRSDRRLYIARRHARVVVNEPEVCDFLGSHGFQRIYMEDMPFADQVELASEAEIIIGPHGAGIALAMFLKPGGALIEFFSPVYVNPCMLPFCNALGLKYGMLVSRKNDNETYPFGYDIMVDVTALSASLNGIL